jgi:eukaryotic-like serine/threonine-protein kinase
MALAPHVRLGPYEILTPLGAGGMGEVYKANDTRLNRVVAIKVMRGHIGADHQLRERFDREARAISSLNHPHICALYDVGTQDGIDFLVMEYLDGETLADRIARDPLSVAESLQIAGQIAEALEVAHETGIVHRDLKPANVTITHGGQVKVLDFGLAKMRASADGELDLSNSPTAMRTNAGVILGTAAYMSPEQTNGREADRASDVWAFGCVLYEMLTGRRAFIGDTASEIIASVLRTEPDWHQLPAETPDAIRRLLRRSLQKDHKLRFRDIRDARLEIDEVRRSASDHDAATAVRAERPRRRGTWIAWTAVATVLVVAAMLGARAMRQPRLPPPQLSLEINTPPTRDASVAISPDGLKVVFVASAEGRSQVWLRWLDSPVARPLSGSDRGSRPFWSPDSRSIGFLADNTLKRLDIDGDSARTLASGIPVALGGTWNNAGTILFGNNPGGPLFRVSDAGGDPTIVTRVETPQQRGHLSPQFLPDGQHFLYFVNGSPEARGVYVGRLDRSDAKRLFDSDAPAVYDGRGHLLLIREGKLLAQGFDPERLELKGDPHAIADQVTAYTVLSASATGTIAYRSASADIGQRQFVWVDRSGRETDSVVYADTAALGPALSHDGRRIAIYSFRNGNMDIWSYETSRRAWDRITFGAGDDIYPLWSPDDSSLVSGSVRTTNIVDLYRRQLRAPEASEELLLATAEPKFPTDWSADGRFLLYQTLSPKRGLDLWALPMDGSRKAFAVVQTDFNEGLGQFSPDGKWVAYQSDRTGRSEIYLRPFPGPGADVRVSVDGGTQARWNSNGKELFYIAIDNRLVAVPIRFLPDGITAESGTPLPLFATTLGNPGGPVNRQLYVVAPGGRSFVMNSATGEGNASPITVILNWNPQPGGTTRSAR